MAMSDQGVNPATPVAESWSCTEVQSLKLSHTWTIKNFRTHLQSRTLGSRELLQLEVLESPRFEAEGFPGMEWSIRLLPRYTDQKNRDWISVFVHLEGADQSILLDGYTLSLLGGTHEKIIEYSSVEPIELVRGESIGELECVELWDVVNFLDEHPSDTLSVRCELRFRSLRSIKSEKPDTLIKSVSQSRLSRAVDSPQRRNPGKQRRYVSESRAQSGTS